jgi:hypothetical protein
MDTPAKKLSHAEVLEQVGLTPKDFHYIFSITHERGLICVAAGEYAPEHKSQNALRNPHLLDAFWGEEEHIHYYVFKLP